MSENTNIKKMEIVCKHIANNGVYDSGTGGKSNDLKVKVSTDGNMNITVTSGIGVFGNKMFALNNDWDFVVEDAPTGENEVRIDSVLVQVNLNTNEAKIIYKTGTPAIEATAPEINLKDPENEEEIKEYRLANITVNSGETSILSSNITDLRGSWECPWIPKLKDEYCSTEDDSAEDDSVEFINVMQEIEKNTTATYVSDVLPNTTSNVVYYFPEGIYDLTEHTFENCNNVTILAHNATFRFNSSESESSGFFTFFNCTNCSVIGGTYDGKNNNIKYGIYFNNSPYSTIKDVEVKRIGNTLTQSSAGICFNRNCSNSKIKNVKIHDIQAGQYYGDYIYASGIAFNAENDVRKPNEVYSYSYFLQYSKNVTIENPCIYNIGTAPFTDGDGVPLKIDGDGIFIIQRPEYVEDITLKATEDEKAYMEATYKQLGIGTYYYYRKLEANVGNSRVVMKYTKVDEKDDCKYSVEVLNETESNIKIINPHIFDCSKRAIKVSARCVDIIGGNIDVATWDGAAVDYQYARNSTVRDVRISNKTMTCLTICGGDGLMTVENCYFSGDGSSNGIVLSKENDTNSNIKFGSENVIISKCYFENLNYPIYSDTSERAPVVSENVVIKDCTIGHFSGKRAIYLSAKRFASLNKLEIKNISFKYGTTISDIFNANNAFYDAKVSKLNPIYIGTVAEHINPISSLIIDINTLDEDFNKLFMNYGFSTKKVYFGEDFSLNTDVHENYNYNYISFKDLNGNESTNTYENNGLKAIINNKNSFITVNGTRQATGDIYTFVPIKDFCVYKNVEYVIHFTASTIYTNTEVSIGLFVDNNTELGDLIAMDSYNKKVKLLLNNTDGEYVTAKYIGIKLKSNAGETEPIDNISTEITFKVTKKLPDIRGVAELQSRLALLETTVNDLVNQTTTNE